jgi:TRAP-type C4-dicarboxylate transport system permease small subunit
VTIFKILNLTVEFVFFVYLIPYAFLYLKATIESGQVSPACGIPMYYVQSAPLVSFTICALRIVQRWFGEWHILLKKEDRELEEGDLASVIEEAVVERKEK